MPSPLPDLGAGWVQARTTPHPDARVLVVDDEEPIRRALARVLTDAGYRCDTAANAAEARLLLAMSAFDLMLCDVIMPNESGLSLLASVHDDYPDMAVIMVTAVDDPRVAEPIARYGAYGYILKPFASSAIVINVAGALQRRAEVRVERSRTADLRVELDERAHQLADAAAQLEVDAAALHTSREETVNRLALTAEWRDPHTGKHLQQMSSYSARLAALAGRPTEEVELLRVASKLHDIGKIAIPDEILRSCGPLTPEERAVMQQHPRIGAEILKA
ncbi:MAG TPA: response regulator, partial [Acidimicrobiales bacterium]|nr:response regulator [Acidimicrobiales bacterium]